MGNVFYFEIEDYVFLVDVGLSGKVMDGLMVQIGCKLDDVDGIFVMYEYSDYIKGFGVVVRKYKFLIYVNEKIWKVMEN